MKDVGQNSCRDREPAVVFSKHYHNFGMHFGEETSTYMVWLWISRNYFTSRLEGNNAPWS